MRTRLRTQLLVLSSALLLLPWLGYRYIADIQNFLLEGQQQAQLLTAQAIATSLQERPQLLADLPSTRTSNSDRVLYAFPTDQNVLADGYSEEWLQHPEASRYGPVANADRLDPLSFRSRFLQRDDQLFALFEISDRYPVYRHPGLLRLDTSDQLRLTIGHNHYVVTAEAPGRVRVFSTSADWEQSDTEKSDADATGITGGWVETTDGYRIELQLPVSLPGATAIFNATVVDIDDAEGRNIREQLSSSSAGDNQLLTHSPDLQRQIRGLRRAGRHIWILDRNRRVRAVSSTTDAQLHLPEHHIPAVERALAGLPAVRRYQLGSKDYILAAQPILDADQNPLGVAVVEVSSDNILGLQRITLLKSAAATILVLVLLVSGLLIFSYRLTRRIQRLQSETRSCTDDQGRLQASTLSAGQESNDELGQLAADMSALVNRLHHYTRFLERMPRTLRHELSNPLNTISTSLEILAEDAVEQQQNYLDSAARGVARLTMIIESITEAASLEEALRGESLQAVNLSRLLSQYVSSLQSRGLPQQFELELPTQQAWVLANDLRLEQLLDKLTDNAVDFAPAGSRIRLTLSRTPGEWKLQICNQGPAIPEQLGDSLFDSLVSGRENHNSGGMHLGIGLFVARTIIEHHHGRISARNRGNEVCFELQLPTAEAPDATP